MLSSILPNSINYQNNQRSNLNSQAPMGLKGFSAKMKPGLTTDCVSFGKYFETKGFTDLLFAIQDGVKSSKSFGDFAEPLFDALVSREITPFQDPHLNYICAKLGFHFPSNDSFRTATETIQELAEKTPGLEQTMASILLNRISDPELVKDLAKTISKYSKDFPNFATKDGKSLQDVALELAQQENIYLLDVTRILDCISENHEKIQMPNGEKLVDLALRWSKNYKLKDTEGMYPHRLGYLLQHVAENPDFRTPEGQTLVEFIEAQAEITENNANKIDNMVRQMLKDVPTT
ncbi:MAG: hypothetical protein PHC64_00930 [Candidatus Gastranaerophilales bacterium]|nr:hypothetical protein [Candidatus Gastranaerophilales bacterium]